MTYVVKTKLKERSKLSDTYCKYCKMKSDLHKIIAKTNECAETISFTYYKCIIHMFKKTE